MIFADVIVDISHEDLDKTYQYIVKEEQAESAVIGARVLIPFGKGNRQIKGYIVGLSGEPKWDVTRMKELDEVIQNEVIIESQLIHLAYWIKEHYGSTMNDALKTVIPVKKLIKNKAKRYVKLAVSREEATDYLQEFVQKNNRGRVRLLEELLDVPEIDESLLKTKLNIASTTITGLEKMGVITITSEIVYRNPIVEHARERQRMVLNLEQMEAVNGVLTDYHQGIRKTYLVHGITGSGKTEVYMEIIEGVLKEGRQVIMLIPEIALTYQTVMRFYKRFGDRISILNSRMSQGERYDQYTRAKNGEIDIMIGPRSALFTPFSKLGLIIIDEEHEGSYKSENVPKYHARETAIERARLSDASVVLGSATPTIESFYKARQGEYQLFSLYSRAGEGKLPKTEIIDLREELKAKNKSILSRRLYEQIADRIEKKEQTILFINRRGYAGFVSCRSCGHVIKCPHCDISLTSHNRGNLVCHYCGYEEGMPKLCPSCGSPYIAAFGTGTQKIEELVKREFPTARVLRMDLDTTGGKEGHEKILSTFANHEADILIGTQMIVKGHDFKDVTLVGILAADLSLYAGDYRAAERTFDLLAQAAGRAGRGEKPGEVVIQTYNPDHYSVQMAAGHDYLNFYEQEILYRSMLEYPPTGHMVAVLMTSPEEKKVEAAAMLLGSVLGELGKNIEGLKIIGPAKASLAKANDIYRMVLYMKAREEEVLRNMKNALEDYIQYSEHMKKVSVQFDFDPMNSY